MKKIISTNDVIKYLISNIKFSETANSRGYSAAMRCIPSIYNIVCKPTGMTYTGSSSDTLYRMVYHIKSMEIGSHLKRKMVEDYNKYGLMNFEFNILHIVEDEGARIGLEYLMAEELQESGTSYNYRKPRKKK